MPKLKFSWGYLLVVPAVAGVLAYAFVDYANTPSLAEQCSTICGESGIKSFSRSGGSAGSFDCQCGDGASGGGE